MSKAALTLSSLVAQKVKLLERAPGRFAGCRPFHVEQTPAFIVDDSTARFHCLGCGAHGDAVDFVLRTEPVLFKAILQWLGRFDARDGEVSA